MSAFNGNSYIVKLAAPEAPVEDHVYTFLRGLTEVSVNGTVLTKRSGFGQMADNQYDINASAGEAVFSEKTLGNGTGEFTIVMKAEGFQALTFRVVDGALPGMETISIVEEAPAE